MIVVCEGCERRFQLDDSRIPVKGARVRCKHCHHRFRVPPPGDAPTEAADPSVAAPVVTPDADTSASNALVVTPDADTSASNALVVTPDADTSASNALSGMSAGAPGQISAEDTLFGTPEGEGVGAPIDGDRTLFGSLVQPELPPESGAEDLAGESSAGGLTQDLEFVVEPALEHEEDDEPEIEAASEEPPELEPVPELEPAPAMDAAAATDGADAEPVGPAEDEADEIEEPGESSGGEDSWEFVDSSLSFDEELHEDAGEPAGEASEAPPPDEPEEEAEPMQLDPGASHPDASPAVVDDTPSMRPIAPGAGGDAAVFEMVENPDYDAPLQLEGEESSEALAADPLELPAESVAPEEAASESEPAEIGTAADWDRLAADGEPTSEETYDDDLGDASAAVEAAEPEVAPDPDWPSAPDDLPEPAVLASAQAGHAWLEHAGWALSLVLLLAVAQGTVRIEPALHETPPGHVEVAGLMAENVRGRFVENARSGTLFVVSGELRNRGAAARAGGELRVVVLDEHGFTFEGRDAPVGLALSESMVRESPIGALQQQQAALARTLGERALAPGEGVTFQAILSELPDGAVRFRLESVPSEPARGSGRPGGRLAERAPEAG